MFVVDGITPASPFAAFAVVVPFLGLPLLAYLGTNNLSQFLLIIISNNNITLGGLGAAGLSIFG